MNLNDYQNEAIKTAVYPDKIAATYLGIALIGEIGEVFNLYKKELRSDTENLERMQDELGDVLWYLSAISSESNNDLSFIFDRAIIHSSKYLYDREAILTSLLETAIRLRKAMSDDGLDYKYLYHHIYPVVLWWIKLVESYHLLVEDVMDYNIQKLILRQQKDELKVHN